MSYLFDPLIIRDYTNEQKQNLDSLQNQAIKLWGGDEGASVWFYLAKELERNGICHIFNDKDKWGRIRFRLVEFDLDPGNTTYNGEDNYNQLILARKFLLQAYKKLHHI